MVLPIIVGILLTVGFGFGLFLAFGRNESKITTNRPIKAHGVERRMSTARTFAKARLQFERSMNSLEKNIAESTKFAQEEARRAALIAEQERVEEEAALLAAENERIRLEEERKRLEEEARKAQAELEAQRAAEEATRQEDIAASEPERSEEIAATMDMEAAVQGEAMDDDTANRLRERLERSGAMSGEVQISLMWENYNDLDLHVVCPSGERIHGGNRNSKCGGILDVDANIKPESKEPVENVVWPSDPPSGLYRVYVHHYQFHKKRRTKDPTKFEVVVHANGEYTEYEAALSHGDPIMYVAGFEVK